MRNVLCVVALCGGNIATGQVLEETVLWNTGPGANGHEYRLYSLSGGVNWTDAQSHAESLGGYLATVGSALENNFIYNTLAIETNNNVWHVDGFNSQIGPWLGGLQAIGAPEPAGGWGWVTAEPWDYTNWAGGEPNDLGANNNENRIHFFGNPSRTANWNDINADNLVKGYVVEIPAPATLALIALGSVIGVRRRR